MFKTIPSSFDRILFLLLTLLTITRCEFDKPSTIIVRQAGIACADPLAARSGLEVLQSGGNAADALVTVAFTLAVTYPRAGNIGGGGFIVYRDSQGKTVTLDFRETAPNAARFDMYWDAKGLPTPEKSQLGVMAAGIPGTVAGLFQFHQRYGRLPWKHLLQPAIRFAKDGFPVDAALSKLLESHQESFARFPEAYRIFFPGGKPLQPGDTLSQPELASTLEKIAVEGANAFYRGEIAEKIVAAVQQQGGLFTRQDLAGYRPVWRVPVQIDFRGYRIYSMPPPSSGGLVLQGILNTLTELDSRLPPHNSADYLALLSEIEKRWYANRNLYLGDPDFVDIPLEIFQSAHTARQIAQSISIDHPFPARRLPQYRQVMSISSESHQTTHVSVLDAGGNAVSMTYTLNGSFGSHFVAPGTGILLNNEMDDFAAKPGHPNLYGLVQGQANAIAPGKRMLSSMTPAIVEHDGELVGLLGTPGGSTIITSVLQVLLNKIEFGMSLKAAQEAGRFHQQWLPDTVYVEKARIPEKVQKILMQRGFKVIRRERLADIQAIWRSGTKWEISCDPRGGGIPVGY